jgi:hypothetical protein
MADYRTIPLSIIPERKIVRCLIRRPWKEKPSNLLALVFHQTVWPSWVYSYLSLPMHNPPQAIRGSVSGTVLRQTS